MYKVNLKTKVFEVVRTYYVFKYISNLICINKALSVSMGNLNKCYIIECMCSFKQPVECIMFFSYV